VDGRRTVGADPLPLIDGRRLKRVPALSDLKGSMLPVGVNA
jgi:hypothetical protein